MTDVVADLFIAIVGEKEEKEQQYFFVKKYWIVTNLIVLFSWRGIEGSEDSWGLLQVGG